MVKLFYTTYICEDLAHQEIFRAKVGKGGIKGIEHGKTSLVRLLNRAFGFNQN